MRPTRITISSSFVSVMGRKNSNLAIQPLLLEHRALLDRECLMIISCNIVLLRWFVTFFLMLSDLSWVAVCLLWPLIKRKVCVPFDMTPNALEILHQTLNHSSKSPWWQSTGFSSLSLFNGKKLWGFHRRENLRFQQKICEVSTKEKMQGCSTFGEALGK